MFLLKATEPNCSSATKTALLCNHRLLFLLNETEEMHAGDTCGCCGMIINNLEGNAVFQSPQSPRGRPAAHRQEGLWDTT